MGRQRRETYPDAFRAFARAMAWMVPRWAHGELLMLGLPSPALYVGAGLLTLLVASGGLNACQHRENATLRDAVASERAARAAAVSANKSQSDAITKLEKSVALWKAAASISDDLRNQAAQAADYRARLDRQAADLHEVKVHESPDCQSLLAMDFGARCPVLAGRLRELAAGSREGPHRHSGSTGREKAP
jgi:hypothetical protein